MQTLQNRLGIAALSLASLTFPACQRPGHLQKDPEKAAITAVNPSYETPTKSIQLSPSEQMKSRLVERDVSDVLLQGLAGISDGTGSLVPVLVIRQLSTSSSLKWNSDMLARVEAKISDSVGVRVDTINLRAEILKDGVAVRSFSAYQGGWSDGALDTSDDLMRRYLEPRLLKDLVGKLSRAGGEHKAPVSVLHEAWPEWRLIADDKSASKQFVQLLEIKLLTQDSLQESEREELLKTAKFCLRYSDTR